MKPYPNVQDFPLIPDRDPLATARVRDTFAACQSSGGASRDEILQRAYAIWEREGHPENRDMAHWLQAEADTLKAS